MSSISSRSELLRSTVQGCIVRASANARDLSMRVATTAALLLGSMLAGCGGGDGPTGPPPGGTPRIGLPSGQVSFIGVGGGGNPAARTATVTNAGTGALGGLSVGTISYGPGASGWLAAALSATTAPATLTLSPSVAGLAPGGYAASVPITAAGADNSPQSLTVSLLVLEPGGGTISLAPGQS